MPKATNQDGSLSYIASGSQVCQIVTPCGTICLKILPEITDSKAAVYSDTPSPGRSSPMVTYSYSEPRMISSELHFMITTSNDINENWRALRIIQSLVYPGQGAQASAAPYTPPPVSRFVCGQLLDGSDGLCVILRSYSVRYPTEFAWDSATFLPYRFSISCSWEVVYACADLPSNLCSNNIYGPCAAPGQSCFTIGNDGEQLSTPVVPTFGTSFAMTGSVTNNKGMVANTVASRPNVRFARRSDYGETS